MKYEIHSVTRSVLLCNLMTRGIVIRLPLWSFLFTTPKATFWMARLLVKKSNTIWTVKSSSFQVTRFCFSSSPKICSLFSTSLRAAVNLLRKRRTWLDYECNSCKKSYKFISQEFQENHDKYHSWKPYVSRYLTNTSDGFTNLEFRIYNSFKQIFGIIFFFQLAN